jgi:hypothetical protein
MISTRELSRLPDIPTLRRLMRALAMLDAINWPDWEGRYYSFDSQWAVGEMMASMRNGQGDEWHAIFCDAGAALQGLALHAPACREPPIRGIFDGLPTVFDKNLRNEPAFDAARSTFCLWRLVNDDAWSIGKVQLPPGDDPDGSGRLLAILGGIPAHYVAWARDYYEREIAEADVAAVYRHDPLTTELISRLNPNMHLAALAEDIAQIGYPEARDG